PKQTSDACQLLSIKIDELQQNALGKRLRNRLLFATGRHRNQAYERYGISSSIRNGPDCLNDAVRRALKRDRLSPRADSTPKLVPSPTQSIGGSSSVIMRRATCPTCAPTAAYSPNKISYLRLEKMTVVTSSFSLACVQRPCAVYSAEP